MRIASENKRFENLLRWQPDFVRHRDGIKLVLVYLVFPNFVRDGVLVKNTASIGFGHNIRQN